MLKRQSLPDRILLGEPAAPRRAIVACLVHLSAAHLSGCALSSIEATAPAGPPQSRLDRIELRIAELNSQVVMLQESLPLLMCGPELRALFREIRRECSASAPEPLSTPATAPGSSENSSLCPPAQLRGALTTAQRDLNSRSIGASLLSLLRHEVVYLDDRQDMISSLRRKRLADLVGERVLSTTRFLLVTAPVRGMPDAQRRAKVVMDALIQQGIKPELFDKPWLYSLRIGVAQMRTVDRPVPTESSDVERAVYVFRVDC